MALPFPAVRRLAHESWCAYTNPRLPPSSPASPRQTLYVKKVALLFLTVHRLAHKKLWRLWMWDAAGQVPRQALPMVQVGARGAG